MKFGIFPSAQRRGVPESFHRKPIFFRFNDELACECVLRPIGGLSRRHCVWLCVCGRIPAEQIAADAECAERDGARVAGDRAVVPGALQLRRVDVVHRFRGQHNDDDLHRAPAVHQRAAVCTSAADGAAQLFAERRVSACRQTPLSLCHAAASRRTGVICRR
jgi:hypothetical protein